MPTPTPMPIEALVERPEDAGDMLVDDEEAEELDVVAVEPGDDEVVVLDVDSSRSNSGRGRVSV